MWHYNAVWNIQREEQVTELYMTFKQEFPNNALQIIKK